MDWYRPTQLTELLQLKQGTGSPQFSLLVHTLTPPSPFILARQLPIILASTYSNHYLQVFPAARLVVGNTEVGIETKFKNMVYPVQIGTTHVPELAAIKEIDGGIHIGASVSIAAIERFFEKLVAERPREQTFHFSAVLENIRWFAGPQIRRCVWEVTVVILPV